jgi:hypothetical protein
MLAGRLAKVPMKITKESLMSEADQKEIWTPYQAFYIQSMLFNTEAAFRSVSQIQALMAVTAKNSPEDPFSPLYGGRFLNELQNVVLHAAALSRYFWPVRKGHHWRGDQLREVFQVGENSALYSRDLRNAIEHFDEKLDTYLEGGVVGHILPEYIGPFSESTGVPIHIFRAYYVDTAVFQLLDKRYEIQPIVDELARIHEQLQTIDKSGAVFRRTET